MRRMIVRFIGICLAVLLVLPLAAVGAEAADNASALADVYVPRSNLVLAPTLVLEVKGEDDYGALLNDRPTVAVFEAAIDGSSFGANIDGKFVSVGKIISELENSIIPAFKVDSLEEAKTLGNYAKSQKSCDMYVISEDVSYVSAARSICNKLYGMYDASSYSGDIEALRVEINQNDARGVILSLDYAKRANVSYLQDRYLSVWVRTNGKDIESVAAINSGALGVISPNIGATEKCLTKYYSEGTLTRTPEIVGHRGAPSIAQENSVAGMLKAYEVGATVAECDIFLMKDGNVLVMHDTTLERTTNGTGDNEDQTAESIKNIVIDLNTAVATEPVPLLDDYLKELKKTGKVLAIETSSGNTAIAKPLVELIKKYDVADQIVIISKQSDMIKAIKAEDSSLSFSWVNSSIVASESNALGVAKQVIDNVVPINATYMPKKSDGAGIKLYSALAHRGITTWTWTVYDNQSQLDSFFVSGMRGITTDYPQNAAELFESLDANVSGGKLRVSANKYSGESFEPNDYKIVSVKGEVKLSATGTLTLDNCNEAYFFVEYTTKTPTGIGYTLVSELIRVETEKAVATEVQTTESETSESTDASKKKGCGSTVSVMLPFVTVLPTAALMCRRKRRHN